jgi:predicted DNA-binding protein
MIARLLLVPFLLFTLLPAQTAKDRLGEVQQKLKKISATSARELIEQADKDPDPAVRRLILDRLGRTSHPGVREALERHAATDPDASVAMAALDRLRRQQAQDLQELFEKRLEQARAQKDQKSLDALAAAHQRWVTLGKGAVVPEFLQQAPPVFAAAPAKPSVRVFAFGDFGVDGPDQRAVAAAVAAFHRKSPFDFGLTLGDNFAPDGVLDLADPRWKSGWEQIYSPAGVPVYAVTGNHDWGFADSPAAEILYSAHSPTWRMPALYYTFTAGPAQFFALATQAMSETQLQWLDRELTRSTARWKIVYAHHPIYSYGPHGPQPGLQERLLPILRNRVNLYLVGHEHILQDLKPEAGVHFLVNVASGQKSRESKSGAATLHADSFYGFCVFDIDQQRIHVRSVDVDGKTRYETDYR